MTKIKGHISQIIGPVIDVFSILRDKRLRKCYLKFMMHFRLSGPMERHWSWKFSSTSVKTPFAVLPWITLTVCNVDSKRYL